LSTPNIGNNWLATKPLSSNTKILKPKPYSNPAEKNRTEICIALIKAMPGNNERQINNSTLNGHHSVAWARTTKTLVVASQLKRIAVIRLALSCRNLFIKLFVFLYS